MESPHWIQREQEREQKDGGAHLFIPAKKMFFFFFSNSFFIHGDDQKLKVLKMYLF